MPFLLLTTCWSITTTQTLYLCASLLLLLFSAHLFVLLVSVKLQFKRQCWKMQGARQGFQDRRGGGEKERRESNKRPNHRVVGCLWACNVISLPILHKLETSPCCNNKTRYYFMTVVSFMRIQLCSQSLYEVAKKKSYDIVWMGSCKINL